HAVLKLTPRPGTDVAWINGLMHVILKEALFDKAFIQTRTEGFEHLKKSLEKYTPAFVESITGIAAHQLETAARIYAGAVAGNIVYCMGITQHSSGTDNVKALANLAMLCGNLGIVGGGVNPLRGQNNVQGACDMGCLPNVYSGYQSVTETSITKKMEDFWETTNLPDAEGLKVTEMIPGAMSGRIKALYIIGENPMVSDPDLKHTEKSLRNLEFLVVQDLFLSETAQLADVILPATCFAEKEGTFTNTERKVQRVRQAVAPPGLARDDWRILSDLAARMGAVMDYPDAETIFNEIARVTPSYTGISYQRIETDGLVWPCPTPDHPGTPVLHAGKFTRGLGKFHTVAFLPPAEVPDEDYPLILTTGRLLYQYHTGTMTMKSEDLNERAPECRVEISPADAFKIKIVNGEMVRVASRRGEIQARAAVTSKIVSGTVFIPFHFAVAAANCLTHSALDPVCGIPELKVCAVAVSPASNTLKKAQ
ncbi:MAG: molybdopterin-dependent oxidoreductase, partial [Desulfatitalea sp.]|nr:molybdopterin-dependent oxidoreductase [Desulfatitalea sp.]NNK01536.1 molybdopterin-dependent oxidoreductase [Desulfatitalea sp.]